MLFRIFYIASKQRHLNIGMDQTKQDTCACFIAPSYHIRAKERAKYATLLHCRTGQKYGLKRSEKMAAQNRKISMSSLVTFSILTNQISDTSMVSLVLFMSFAHVCNQYNARWILNTKSQISRSKASLRLRLFSMMKYMHQYKQKR